MAKGLFACWYWVWCKLLLFYTELRRWPWNCGCISKQQAHHSKSRTRKVPTLHLQQQDPCWHGLLVFRFRVRASTQKGTPISKHNPGWHQIHSIDLPRLRALKICRPHRQPTFSMSYGMLFKIDSSPSVRKSCPPKNGISQKDLEAPLNAYRAEILKTG